MRTSYGKGQAFIDFDPVRERKLFEMTAKDINDDGIYKVSDMGTYGVALVWDAEGFRDFRMTWTVYKRANNELLKKGAKR